MAFSIQAGFAVSHRPQIAAMYWQAFGGKLGKIMRPDDKAVRFFESIINPDFAVSAVSETGHLLGVAGYKTAQGAFTGGGLRDLAQIYGWVGAVWRGLLLAFLERDLTEKVLLMDGIFVSENARGQGVGSALLDAICDEARARELSAVRLDVIDTNPRAKQLYERKGFVAGATTDIGPLKYLFGFNSSVSMEKLVT